MIKENFIGLKINKIYLHLIIRAKLKAHDIATTLFANYYKFTYILINIYYLNKQGHILLYLILADVLSIILSNLLFFVALFFHVFTQKGDLQFNATTCQHYNEAINKWWGVLGR